MNAAGGPIVCAMSQVDTGYGSSHVLHRVSLEIRQGEVVALLGRNGAGKTTTLRALMGLTPAWRGAVQFLGRDVTKRPSWVLAGLGMAWVPEDRRIFPRMTVRENLEVAARPRPGAGRPWTLERVWEVFPELQERMRWPGARLSGGEQQMLSIARALMGSPVLLLLDEPSEGLAPVVVQRLGALLRALRQEVTILLAEQNARFALALADRGYVIDDGRIRYAGSARELEADPELQRRLLAV